MQLQVSLDGGISWQVPVDNVIVAYKRVGDPEVNLALTLNNDGVVVDVCEDDEIQTSAWLLVDDLIELTH